MSHGCGAYQSGPPLPPHPHGPYGHHPLPPPGYGFLPPVHYGQPMPGYGMWAGPLPAAAPSAYGAPPLPSAVGSRSSRSRRDEGGGEGGTARRHRHRSRRETGTADAAVGQPDPHFSLGPPGGVERWELHPNVSDLASGEEEGSPHAADEQDELTVGDGPASGSHRKRCRKKRVRQKTDGFGMPIGMHEVVGDDSQPCIRVGGSLGALPADFARSESSHYRLPDSQHLSFSGADSQVLGDHYRSRSPRDLHQRSSSAIPRPSTREQQRAASSRDVAANCSSRTRWSRSRLPRERREDLAMRRSRSRLPRERREDSAQRRERERDREERHKRLDELSRAKRYLSQAVKEGRRRDALEHALTMIELQESPPQDLMRGMLENAASRLGPDLFAKTLKCCLLGKLRLNPQEFAKILGVMLSRDTAHAQIRATLNLALPPGSKPIPLVSDDLTIEETRASFQDAEVAAQEDGENATDSEAEERAETHTRAATAALVEAAAAAAAAAVKDAAGSQDEMGAESDADAIDVDAEAYAAEEEEPNFDEECILEGEEEHSVDDHGDDKAGVDEENEEPNFDEECILEGEVEHSVDDNGDDNAGVDEENEAVPADIGGDQLQPQQEMPLILDMTGCLAMPELNGEFHPTEPALEVLGHDRPIYVRAATTDTHELGRDVVLYYSEGDAKQHWTSGWWMSYDSVAGDEVIAYNPEASWSPPESRWQVLSSDGQRRPDPALLIPRGKQAKPPVARTPEETEQALMTISLPDLQGCLSSRTPELTAYFGHFTALLHLEHLAELGQHRRRLLRHPLGRLVKIGWALADLQCTGCFGQRESKKGGLPGWPDKGSEFVVFSLPWGTDVDRLRIKRGDSIILSRGDPFQERVGDGIVAELDSKKIIVNLAAKMPEDARKTRWRMDAFVNRTVYERQMTALLQLAADKTQDPVLELVISGSVGSLDAWAERAVVAPWHRKSVLAVEAIAAEERRQAARGSRCARLAAEDARGLDAQKVEEARAVVGSIADLNDSQKAAIQAALSRRCTIIQGPPGTGKTHVSVKLLFEMAKTVGLRHLLATSDSNVAVDNIAQGLHRAGVKVARVGRPEKIRGHLDEIMLENMLDRAKAKKKLAEEEKAAAEAAAKAAEAAERAGEEDSVDEGLGELDVEADLDEKMEEVPLRNGKGSEKHPTSEQELQRGHNKKRLQRREDFETRMQILGDMEVICSTTIASGSDFLSRFNFQCVLIDEVAQSTELSSVVPVIMRGAKQLVLVGDHCQLPPSVISREAELRGLSVSVYTRLMDCGIEPHFLDTQYRSHPRIMEFSAKCFYHGTLRSGVRGSSRPVPKGVPWPNPLVPVAFFEVGEDETLDGESKANHAEASRLRDLILDVLDEGEIDLSDIGVVTPYMAQVRLLRRMLREALPKDCRTARLLEIASVDNFQGREKELIIFSAVRCNRRGNVGFLADWRRLNVMLTRARRGLVVFGASKTLRHDPHWQQWLEWCNAQKAVATCLDAPKRKAPQQQAALWWQRTAANTGGKAVLNGHISNASRKDGYGSQAPLPASPFLIKGSMVLPTSKAKAKARSAPKAPAKAPPPAPRAKTAVGKERPSGSSRPPLMSPWSAFARGAAGRA